MMKAAECLSWLDLPSELLGLVLKHLPSLADRVRLRAVCQPWRSDARLQSPSPPLPWLSLLDGTFMSIPDGKIIRMAVPDNAHCYGSIDNWLFLMQIDGGCSLMNPFSKATLDLPKLATVWCRDWSNSDNRFTQLFYKLVVPSPLDSSPESLVAVLIVGDADCSTVCICQPPVATDLSRGRGVQLSWSRSRSLSDVAFFNGKLYGIVFGKLVTLEIGYDLGSKPKISAADCIINYMDDLWDLPQSLSIEKPYMSWEYLVEWCGRLLKVTRFIQLDRTIAFNVFEADLSTNPCQWRRVNDLGSQALFVGRHCSKSFPPGEYNGIQEDCIYFMCDYMCPDYAVDPLRDSGVYNLRNGMITPLLSQTATVPQHHGG
ncbi:hypothetical protein C2845_PM09G03060 [Panicum miliaceum]|uniref:F-box domain-containing protein n=1 Tax=Panicum miliaceum TaxID=4540 RepID=A0A3L6RZF9_PANMI|nr:hypothetical protein C2845_PM09G03060 [Panicum miliaceum]